MCVLYFLIDKKKYRSHNEISKIKISQNIILLHFNITRVIKIIFESTANHQNEKQ